jgi:hypothetical protein
MRSVFIFRRRCTPYFPVVCKGFKFMILGNEQESGQDPSNVCGMSTFWGPLPHPFPCWQVAYWPCWAVSTAGMSVLSVCLRGMMPKYGEYISFQMDIIRIVHIYQYNQIWTQCIEITVNVSWAFQDSLVNSCCPVTEHHGFANSVVCHKPVISLQLISVIVIGLLSCHFLLYPNFNFVTVMKTGTTELCLFFVQSMCFLTPGGPI